MKDKVMISSVEWGCLIANLILSTGVLFVPSVTAGTAKQDAWLAGLLATGFGLGITLLLTALWRRLPDQNLIQAAEIILGKWPGRLVSLFYLWWLLHTTAAISQEFGDIVLIGFLPETPFIVIILVGIALSAYAVRSGLEVIARLNLVFLPLVISLLLLSHLLVINVMDGKNLLPVGETGLSNLVKGAIPTTAWLGELVVMWMFLPCLNQNHEVRTASLTGILVTGLLFVLTDLIVVAVFGPVQVASFVISTLNAARMIHIAASIERVEAFTLGIWVFGGVVKISLFYLAFVYGLAEWLKLRDYRPLVLPAGGLIVAMGMLNYRNIVELFHFAGKSWPVYSLLTVEVGLPVLMLLVALGRGIKAQPRGNGSEGTN
ncbi:MAG: endospore germination permease [Firmicutes bacterium]|nr:endospore germination permease [Bacillota bacterium]